MSTIPRPTGLYLLDQLKNARQVLLLLAAIDVTLIVASGILIFTYSGPERGWYSHPLNISSDIGIGEHFNFFKELVAILFALLCYMRQPNRIYLALAVVFLVILVDDAFQFHENLGARISWRLPEDGLAGISSGTIGEMAVFLTMGVIASCAMAIGLWRQPPEHRRLGYAIIAVVLAMAFFGVGVDAMRPVVFDMSGSKTLNIILGLVENGGELITISMACAIMIEEYRRHAVLLPSNS